MADPDRAEAIARAGQKLIANNHSVDARARDLGVILNAIAGNKFAGSYWQNGRHHLREPQMRSVA